MGYVFVLGIIVSFALSFSNLLNKKMDITIPISVMTIISILYIFGIFNILNIGFIGICVLAALSLIYSISYLYKIIITNKGYKYLFNIIFTPGFLIWLLLYIMFVFLNKDRMFISWDEFSHWGLVVKNIWYLEKFGTAKEATVIFKGYPPYTAIFEWFFLKVRNYYTEGAIIIASNTLIISFIVPIFKSINWKKSLKNIIPIIFTIILLPMIFYPEIYTTIYVDGILGIISAYILYIYFYEEYNLAKNISIYLGLFALPLIKASGTGLAVFNILIIFVDTCIMKNKNKLKENKNKILLIIISVIIIFISKYSWKAHTNCMGAGEAWNTSNLTLNGINKVLTGQEEEYQYTTINNFINQVFLNKIDLGSIQVTTVEISIIFIIFSIIIYTMICKNKESIIDRRRYEKLVFVLFVCFLIYLLSLLLLYLFTYSSYEATRLASYSRYIFTMLLQMFMINIYIFTEVSKKANIENIILCLVVILCSPKVATKDLFISSKISVQSTIQQRDRYSDILKFKQYFNSGDKVYYISCGSQGFDSHIMRYNLVPIQINTGFTWSPGTARYEGDIWYYDIEYDDWKQELKNYTYLYINNYDNIFKEKYREVFDDKLENKTLYKIKLNNDKMKLSKFKEI